MNKKNDKEELFHKFKIAYCSFIIFCVLFTLSMPQVFKLADVIKAKTKYSSEIDLYNKIINDMKEIFQRLNITDPIEIFVLYINLYNSGVISNTFGFDFYNPISDAKEITGYQGMNVVKGIGLCRHISTFLNDLFKSLGYESYIILNNYGHEEKTIEYDKINIYSKEFDDNFFNTLEVNHAYNLVFYKDKVYILDPTNKMILNYSKNGELKIINGSGTTYLKLFDSYYKKYNDINDSIKIRNILKNYEYPTKEEAMEKIKLGLEKYKEYVNEFRYNMDEDAVEELKKRLILIDRS